MSAAPGSPDAEAVRARAWVTHLRAGGTTPWHAWQPTGGLASSGTRVLPGAQQLELLRRLNLAGPVDVALADRVLATPAAGRGKADLPLPGLADPSFGPRAVDPSVLRPHELLRVASVLLAEDLVGLGPDAVRSSVPRPWRRRFRLVGDPVVVAGLRSDLVARGRPEGGPRPHVVAVAGPLDRLVAHTWTQRCFEHGTRPWADWLRFWSERGQLPARADVPASIRRWQPRRPLVRVVTERSSLPRQLGVRRLPTVPVPGAEQAELARRVAAVVGLKVPADRRPALMRTLRGRMPGGGEPVAVPPDVRDWLVDAAGRSIRDLTRAGYPVVGDLADLAPQPGGAGTAAADDRVLDLAIRMVVDPTWRTRAPGPEESDEPEEPEEVAR